MTACCWATYCCLLRPRGELAACPYSLDNRGVGDCMYVALLVGHGVQAGGSWWLVVLCRLVNLARHYANHHGAAPLQRLPLRGGLCALPAATPPRTPLPLRRFSTFALFCTRPVLALHGSLCGVDDMFCLLFPWSGRWWTPDVPPPTFYTRESGGLGFLRLGTAVDGPFRRISRRNVTLSIAAPRCTGICTLLYFPRRENMALHRMGVAGGSALQAGDGGGAAPPYSAHRACFSLFLLRCHRAAPLPSFLRTRGCLACSDGRTAARMHCLRYRARQPARCSIIHVCELEWARYRVYSLIGAKPGGILFARQARG